jgi:predicted transposase/invertase (TIGR01784 family)
MDAKVPIYINPYTDFGFKKLFGEEGNKDLLIDFLNQLLPERHQILELEFKNVEVLPGLAEERKAFFDIHCKSVGGETFIVEMQKAKVKYFKDRALFYSMIPIRDQAQRGGEWNFKLEPVYFIAILDFLYDEKEELAKFRRDISLKDQDCEDFFDKLHFRFLQMPAFKLKEHELVTHFDKWCYFLKNLESFAEIPNILREPIFEKAFQTARVANFTPAQRDAYEQSIMDYIGIREVAVTAKEEGKIEGIIEGKIAGIMERDTQLVIRFHKRGKSAEEISETLDIDILQVQSIIEEYQHQNGAEK